MTKQTEAGFGCHYIFYTVNLNNSFYPASEREAAVMSESAAHLESHHKLMESLITEYTEIATLVILVHVL